MEGDSSVGERGTLDVKSSVLGFVTPACVQRTDQSRFNQQVARTLSFSFIFLRF